MILLETRIPDRKGRSTYLEEAPFEGTSCQTYQRNVARQLFRRQLLLYPLNSGQFRTIKRPSQRLLNLVGVPGIQAELVHEELSNSGRVK
jgi:hypothetical protein